MFGPVKMSSVISFQGKNFLGLIFTFLFLPPPFINSFLDVDIETNTNFIVTSTHVDLLAGQSLIEKYRTLNPRIPNQECQRLDLYIPDHPLPLVICLRSLSSSSSIFHNDFTIQEQSKGGKVEKIMTLNDLHMRKNLVHGFIVSFEPSNVNGWISNGVFYGTIVYPQGSGGDEDGKEMKICTISPLSTLENYMNEQGDVEKEEIQQLIQDKIVQNGDKNLTSIVSCGDDYLQATYSMTDNRVKRNSRFKREKSGGEDHLTRRKMPRRHVFRSPISYRHSKEHKYLTVSFFVDPRVRKSHFDDDVAQLTAKLSSYVEMMDWLTRAQDFNNDRTPDNFGFKLAKVTITEEYHEPENSSHSTDLADHLRGRKAQDFFEHQATVNKVNEHSVNIAIVPIDNPVYLHLPMDDDKKTVYDGCTACHSQHMLQGLINPSQARYSQRGEMLRLFFGVMHVMAYALVSIDDTNNNACLECTDMDGSVEADGGDAWGACLIEGTLLDTSNIPLNTFRLSRCSLEDGPSCINEILPNRTVNGQTCIQYEESSSFCGNGIVEAGEECDCGTLATCAIQKCHCGPRNGVMPCIKLSGAEAQFCRELIKCRGFRFLHELGQVNGSHILDYVPEILDSRVPR